MALCQPYPFSETAKQNVRCQVLISLQLTVASRPTSQSGHRVFSVFCGSAEAHPAQCCSLLRLTWDGILRIAFFFLYVRKHSKEILVGEETYKKKSARGCLCRTCWMPGIRAEISSHGSFFPPGRSRGRIGSYSAHSLPFLSLPCAAPGSALSVHSMHYQHPPPYHLIAAPQGPPSFIALFLFLLCW